MSLPPTFLEELRDRVTLSSVVGRKVMWDMRKSNQAKGDWWAPCPFHQEKSASFHVDDRKGFYYCFGCQAKGDALTFLRETENMSFMEAVEALAQEAGMPMPARDAGSARRSAERQDRRSKLAEVMEEAIRWYRMQLRSAAAGPARDYLARRRLDGAGQEAFEIGYAPDGRQALLQAMGQKGITPDLLVDAGLCARPEDGGAPYDRFRGRIIFPIRDARGRAISLGGRSMDPNARAKYLNGPETELFDKGRNLYNQGPANAAVRKGARLVVTEGYMDVIALSRAGFEGAVAPLGTAITEDQLRALWKISSEPVVALDGDKAGLRAAYRLIDLALPLIEAGQALRFVILPEGLDPDDLIRDRGAQAMSALLDGAQPMIDLLWQRETEAQIFDSPERRAALDKQLRGVVRAIRDPSIRRHYGDEIARRREALFGPVPARRGGGERDYGERDYGSGFSEGPSSFRSQGGGRNSSGDGFGGSFGGRGKGRRFQRGFGRDLPPALPLSSTRASMLAAGLSEARPGETDMVEEVLREAMILAICLRHPKCVARFESQLERLEMLGEGHDPLRMSVLRLAHRPEEDWQAALASGLGASLEKLMALPHVSIAPPVRNTGDHDQAGRYLADEIAKLTARRGARAEIADAMEDITGLPDEGLTWRLTQAAEARNRAERTNLEDATDLGEDEAALSAKLEAMWSSEIWRKNRS